MDPVVTAPAALGHTKQYVFVDEYNRHKRLKVMRACDGCRKRKIRCDGALQNGPWPCGACLRLKLKCLPPTLDPDDEQQLSSTYSTSAPYPFSPDLLGDSGHVHPAQGPPEPPRRVADWAANVPQPHSTVSPTSFAHPLDRVAQPSHYFGQADSRFDHGYADDERLVPAKVNTSPLRAVPDLVRSHTEISGSSGGDPHDVDATVRELSGQMGDLSIELTSVAPYIANEKKSLAETPAMEEADVVLPLSVGTDTTVRIPPEMMPSDERAMDYFGYFFAYVHPYVPVLSQHAFYDQWRSARHSISPLLLEGVFACVSRYLEDPGESRRWLALAARHEESFKDVPRLSTIQAMILLTKAREFVPRRGYYYRSWMAVKYMTTMAFDLSIPEHHDQHRFGDTCKYSDVDCMIRTRIWQTLFLLEILVGAPQGRTDFAVEPETVEQIVPVASAGTDVFEYQTSRRFTYMTQAVANIKVSNTLWQKMRRLTKAWALDDAFVRHNEALVNWLNHLPPDLQIQYPEDGSPPWLGNDHFLAYIHCYHHLVVIMHHRPQLQQLLERRDQGFKIHLDVCLQSAASICKLQEALIRDFGLHGLSFMTRGTGYNIYCVLTCTMLHLAAITSPDPNFNSQARMYFTRHMRVLEHCISSATPEIKAQINALREAFSVDTMQPFELKPSLGLRSPTLETAPTPSAIQQSPVGVTVQQAGSWIHVPDAPSSKTMSPLSEYAPPFDRQQAGSLPTLASSVYGQSSYPASGQSSYAPTALHPVDSAPQTGYALTPVLSNEQATPAWDPSGIFQQWNSAFGGQPQRSPPHAQASEPIHPQTAPPALLPQPSPTSHPAHSGMYSAQPTALNVGTLVPDPALPAAPTVTPIMWQNAFTTAYVSGHGNKRYRQDDQEWYDSSKRR
ncbi:hypothetical protein LTR53_003259 [Teratosphaeriaceae sp. CCFEE 6253]|nr:hypothetical protein LTR53_003259 [Teratosphaeriaceae sp. CCFEE 6253]